MGNGDGLQTTTIRSPKKPIPPPWIARLEEFARQIAPNEFSGKVELNFLQGGVTGTNVTQTYRT